MPIWTTCESFQLIQAIFAKTRSIKEKINGNKLVTGLIFDDKLIRSSRMFKFFSEKDFYSLKNFNSTVHFHNYSISEDSYDKYPLLKKFFKITTFGKNHDGRISIESIEAYNYPIYGVQFHPEKVPFDYSKKEWIPQIPEAIRISNNFALFFISEARKNPNIFLEEDKMKFDYISQYGNNFKNVSEMNALVYHKKKSNTYRT